MKRPRSTSNDNKEKNPFTFIQLPLLEDNFHICNKAPNLGNGAYGHVTTAIHLKQNGQLVALKKFNFEMKHAGELAKREIETLARLRDCLYIVKMQGTYKDKQGNLYMAMEHASYDLRSLFEHKETRFWSLEQLKACMYQIMQGVKFMHDARVMHRDLKLDNILCFQKENLFKICDFGMMNNVHKNYRTYSNPVTTLWYRDPQLLLGTTSYAFEVDIWSLACIFGTLLFDQILFPGKDEPHQLQCIWSLCGTPDKEEHHLWPQDVHATLETHGIRPCGLTKRIGKDAGNMKNKRWFEKPSTLDFLQTLLILTPCKRWNVDQLLAHAFFKEERRVLEPWEMVALPLAPLPPLPPPPGGGKK